MLRGEGWSYTLRGTPLRNPSYIPPVYLVIVGCDVADKKFGRFFRFFTKVDAPLSKNFLEKNLHMSQIMRTFVE